MAKADLTLHLEDRREIYRPGDVVRGYVEVHADEEVECRGLTVGLRWCTRGKGTAVSQVVVSEVPFAGRWTAAGVHRYPFALELPAGPFTYHGHYLSVVWEVYAEADVPWAFDPKAEREIALEPGAEAPPDWSAAVGTPSLLPPELQRGDAGETRPPKQLSKAQGLGCLLILLLPVVVLLVTVVTRLLAYSRGEIPGEQALGWALFAVVLLAFVCGGLVKLARNLMAWSRLGQVTVEVEPRRVRSGEELRVKVLCQPRNEAELVGVTATLEARETVVRGSGTNKRSWTEVVHTRETEIALGRNLARGLPFRAEGTVPVPADAPPSFLARRNRLTWTVSVRLDVANWPDWVEKREVLVHP